VALLAALTFAPAAVGDTSAHPTPRVGPIASTVPTLVRAGARGTLLAIDLKSGIAEFRISCGRFIPSKARIRPGLWKVNLRGATFGWAVGQNGQGGGHVEDLNLRQWERTVRRLGWSGTLYVRTANAPHSVWLTNGGATDVCAGVFG
jgi:hypothetical protein